MGATMNEHLAVYRHQSGMESALETIRRLCERYQSVYVQDKGKTWNTNLVFTLELGFMLELRGDDHALRHRAKGEQGRAHPRGLPGPKR